MKIGNVVVGGYLVGSCVFAPSCDRAPRDLSGWESETATIPVYTDSATEPSGVEVLTIWRRGNVEYSDENQDGRIERRIESYADRNVVWTDNDEDGYFDQEYVVRNGILDRAEARGIRIPVPRPD